MLTPSASRPRRIIDKRSDDWSRGGVIFYPRPPQHLTGLIRTENLRCAVRSDTRWSPFHRKTRVTNVQTNECLPEKPATLNVYENHSLPNDRYSAVRRHRRN